MEGMRGEVDKAGYQDDVDDLLARAKAIATEISNRLVEIKKEVVAMRFLVAKDSRAPAGSWRWKASALDLLIECGCGVGLRLLQIGLRRVFRAAALGL